MKSIDVVFQIEVINSEPDSNLGNHIRKLTNIP